MHPNNLDGLPSYNQAAAAASLPPPPSFEEAVSLPPSYDDAVYAFVYDYEAAPLLDQDARGADPSRTAAQDDEILRAWDRAGVARSRRRIGAFSAFLLACNLAVLVGSLAVGRSFGVFYAANVASVLVFGLGAGLLAPLRPMNRMRLAQVFFLALMLLTLVGLVLTLVYAATVSDRVSKYCSLHEDACKEHRSRYAGLSIAAVLVGAVAFVLLFTHYARLTFVHIAATERLYFTNTQRRALMMYRPVHVLGRFLPRYGRLWSSCTRSCLNAESECAHGVGACCAGCVDAAEAACSCSMSDDAVVWLCVAFCCGWFWISLIICAAATGGLKTFGCAMLELLFEILNNL